jgi:hypothetical protein
MADDKLTLAKLSCASLYVRQQQDTRMMRL